MAPSFRSEESDRESKYSSSSVETAVIAGQGAVSSNSSCKLAMGPRCDLALPPCPRLSTLAGSGSFGDWGAQEPLASSPSPSVLLSALGCNFADKEPRVLRMSSLLRPLNRRAPVRGGKETVGGWKINGQVVGSGRE